MRRESTSTYAVVSRFFSAVASASTIAAMASGPSAVNFQRLLRQRAAWIAAGFDFGNEPIGTIIGE